MPSCLFWLKESEITGKHRLEGTSGSHLVPLPAWRTANLIDKIAQGLTQSSFENFLPQICKLMSFTPTASIKEKSSLVPCNPGQTKARKKADVMHMVSMTSLPSCITLRDFCSFIRHKENKKICSGIGHNIPILYCIFFNPCKDSFQNQKYILALALWQASGYFL